MRHKKSGRKLNRSRHHLKAMLKNLTCSLLNYEIIRTTLAKAKELRTVVEPLITRAKKDNVANRRIIFSHIRNKNIVAKLFTDIGPRFIDRNGGYTRILKLGARVGDCAPVAYVELVIRKSNTEVQIMKT